MPVTLSSLVQMGSMRAQIKGTSGEFHIIYAFLWFYCKFNFQKSKILLFLVERWSKGREHYHLISILWQLIQDQGLHGLQFTVGGFAVCKFPAGGFIVCRFAADWFGVRQFSAGRFRVCKLAVNWSRVCQVTIGWIGVGRFAAGWSAVGGSGAFRFTPCPCKRVGVHYY